MPILKERLADEVGSCYLLEGNLTATIANEFIKRVRDLLINEKQANGCLLRGFSQAPHMPLLPQLYKIKPVAIANYPMYKGIARLVGMDVVDATGKILKSF